ncbi:MAG TPA: S8 family serine peptidase [Mycobacteriales bacterium]|nr:S8 family serine peptidase [Mycobacteriales bacterium]
MGSPLLRRRNQALAALGAAGLIAGLATVGPATAAPAPAAGTTATYLVQVSDAPAASYTGGVAGYAATKPATGAKLDMASAAVTRYRGYLRQRQDGVLRQAGSARKLYDYSVAFNGFSARMTAADAAELARTAGVVAVTKDERLTIDTTRTPEFLGLTKPGGAWSQLGGPGARGAGSGVVVGVVDSGVWPESPSLAPLANPQAANGFTGTCQTGEQWTAANCSTKIVGARYYTAGVTAGVGDIKTVFPYEYLSPRDADSHGTHTSTTAVGNYGVDVVVDGTALGKASGMAPNARLATYKVCWGRDEAAAGCYTSDSVKAIEDATADGVDVINFSISGSTTSIVNSVEIAFLGAADAGVFVATSAGNTGPGASTVAHNGPWVTTVAAGTLDRTGRSSVTLGNGTTYTGVGVGAAVPSSPLVLSTAAAAAGASPSNAALCIAGTLDPAKVTGKIVVCDRGVNARTDKSKEVKAAGGVGMVLANTAPSSLNADLHFVPTVHVDQIAGAAIKAYVTGTAAPTASLAKGELLFGVKAPQVASFSARGPALAGAGDLLKPDIMAPGVDVLAGTSPVGNNGRLYDYLSGTSMSSPHMAGLAALVIQKYPNWSPMRVKSALLTTAGQRDNTGAAITTDTNGAAGALDYGSGQVDASRATDPGLAYDNGFADWVRYLCGIGQLSATGSTCRSYGKIDPSDLNTPNIAIGALAGSQTVTRTVTNVSDKAGNYTVSVQAPAGVTTTVTPSTLKLAPGAKGTYQVTFTRASAAFGQYALGALTWADGTHQVRSQIAVRPVAAAAPAEVAGTGTAGSAAIGVTSGFTGTLTASVSAGLTPAARLTKALTATGPGFDSAAPATSDRAAMHPVTVEPGTTVLRQSTFDRDFAAGTDVDIYLYRVVNGVRTLVGIGGGATAEEQIQLLNPAAGTYELYVVLFGAAPGQTTVDVPAFSWLVSGTPVGNMTVAPASQAVQAGQLATVTASWSGLTAGDRYLGRVAFGDGTVSAGSTFVRVDG